MTLEFSFLCDLCPRVYTLTLASHDPDGSAHDWLDDAVAVTVTDERWTAGVANLRAKVTMEMLEVKKPVLEGGRLVAKRGRHFVKPEIVVSVVLGNPENWHLRGHEAARRLIDRALRHANEHDKDRTVKVSSTRRVGW